MQQLRRAASAGRQKSESINDHTAFLCSQRATKVRYWGTNVVCDRVWSKYAWDMEELLSWPEWLTAPVHKASCTATGLVQKTINGGWVREMSCALNWAIHWLNRARVYTAYRLLLIAIGLMDKVASGGGSSSRCTAPISLRAILVVSGGGPS